MFSKRSLEGELLIDHRASPGLTAKDVAGLDVPVVGAGQVFESATNTCNHCSALIVLNPLRTRDRQWCSYCDKYICDGCAAELKRTLRCNSVSSRLDELFEQIVRGVPDALHTKL